MTAGVAGFVGAYFTGPRLGIFKREPSLEYLLADENFDERQVTIIDQKLDQQSHDMKRKPSIEQLPYQKNVADAAQKHY